MKKLVFLALVLLPARAHAQAAEVYNAPSEALWHQMVQSLDGISMPGPANRQMLQVLWQVQQQAAKDAAAKQPEKKD